MAEAGLVVENGAGYDGFLSQLLGATTYWGRVVVSAQDVLGATGPDVNPHFWYEIPRVPQVATAIEAALARLEPWGARVFAANLAAFDRSLGPVEAVISDVIKVQSPWTGWRMGIARSRERSRSGSAADGMLPVQVRSFVAVRWNPVADKVPSARCSRSMRNNSAKTRG